jgi:bifunctional non-homologous end joining protein LigD
MCTSSAKGDGWLFEAKFDGYRMQVHKAGAHITLYARNGADWTILIALQASPRCRARRRSSMFNGNDLRAVSLEDRKRRRGHLMERARIGRLHHSEAFMDGERLLAECNKRGLEGVVAKHKNGIYRSGRSTSRACESAAQRCAM